MGRGLEEMEGPNGLGSEYCQIRLDGTALLSMSVKGERGPRNALDFHCLPLALGKHAACQAQAIVHNGVMRVV